MRSVAIRKSAAPEQSAPLREVVKQLIAAARATDADAIGAPSIGYDARVVVLKSGRDARVLINPEITQVSPQTTVTWDADGDMVHRVLRPRTVSVKYTTMDGDEEEWYSLAASESLWLQRVLEAMDGATAAEKIAPCVAPEPEAYPEAVTSGLLSSVPRTLFAKYESVLAQLADVKYYRRDCRAA